MKAYHGIPGGFVVRVKHGNRVRLLYPERSQRLINHSPDGFSWGYGGSGPAQLALALLLDATGDKDLAMHHYQDFKWDVVAKWSTGLSWDYTEQQIKDWLALMTEGERLIKEFKEVKHELLSEVQAQNL